MVDRFVERERTGLFGNVGKSFMGIPIGILLFLGSFVLLWKVEGRTNWADVAKTATTAPAEPAGGHDGALVSVTGTLGAASPLGDEEMLAPGPWLVLERVAEMYAWDEKKETETKKKLGGGEEKVTTYTYEMEWTASPEQSNEFKYPEGHQNPPMRVPSRSFVAEGATVGAWGFDAPGADLPSPDPLPLSGLELLGDAAQGERVADQVYLRAGAAQTPAVGDLRVSFRALPTGGTFTLFGQATGEQVLPYMHEGEDKFYELKAGTREQATAEFLSEYKMLGWIGRIAGFVLMWLGMTLVFSPIHAIADILPFAGRMSRGLVGLVTFPIALVLSLVTTLVSMLFHSLIAMIAVGLLVLGGIVVYARSRAGKSQEA